MSAIAAAVGRAIRFEVITPEQARAIYLRQGGFASANAEFLLGFEDYAGEVADPDAVAPFDPVAIGLPTAEQVTGRPGRTFAQWAVDHAADFGATSLAAASSDPVTDPPSASSPCSTGN